MQKFYDANERSPQGGWHYFVDPDARGGMISGNSAQAVFEEIKRYRVNNSLFNGDELLWEELWQYWCAREPGRCVGDPSAFTMAKGLVSATVRTVGAAVTGQPVIESSEGKKSRTDICNACEFFNKNDGRCRQCGCFVKAKTALAQERCPIGRW